MAKNITVKVNGTSTNFPDVKQVEFDTVGGGTAVFVEEDEVFAALQDVEITENGEYTADSGYYGLGTVTVNVPEQTGFPILISTEAGMTAFLETAQTGQIVKYTGSTGSTYVSGALYEVV